MSDNDPATEDSPRGRPTIRRATGGDMDHVVALDAKVTGNAKPEYWQDIFERYATRRLDERFFLIAENNSDPQGKAVLGYVVGEVRGWEFGSEPCGWIFAFSVEPDTREQGIGEQLFQAMVDAFKSVGIGTMRTMVSRKNNLSMAFFRSEGMVAGPYIQLEMNIDEDLVDSKEE